MQALPDCHHGWTVIPTGRTSWVTLTSSDFWPIHQKSQQGLDWHGPSAQDAWSALDALTSILEKPLGCYLPSLIKIPPNSKAVIVGHSNGGQGTWYLASRFPDRVLAGEETPDSCNALRFLPCFFSHTCGRLHQISSLCPSDFIKVMFKSS